MKFVIPIKTVSEANRRDHWAVKARRAKGQRDAARAFTYGNTKLRISPKSITLTRVGPRTLDSDNLAGSLKAVRDGIADALGINDAADIWHYGQRKGKTYAVEVEIE